MLELGSSAGTDASFAALKVGAEGQVTGLDMTDAMLEKAGFRVEKTSPNDAHAFCQDSTLSAAAKFRVHSISILARRL